MTREHKLAIIVGFSLVLVVGILISDHLSPASLDEPTDLLAVELPIGRRELPPAIVPGVVHRAESVPESRGGFDATNPDTALATDRPGITDPLLVPVPEDRPVAPLVIELGGSNGRTPPGTVRSDSGSNSPPIVPGPSYAMYTVQARDSLSDIARQHLGSATRWREIAAANPDKVGKNGEIRSGDVLRIPLANRSIARTPEVKVPEVKSEPARPAASTRTYVVKPNDSLSQIAQKTLGSSRRMNEILALNKDKIDDPNEIYVGLTLRLPPR